MDDQGKSGRRKGIRLPSLNTQGVDSQAKVAVVLLSLIPALSCFYIGITLSTLEDGSTPPYVLPAILLCTGIVAVAGYLVLRTYSRSIVKLRRYVMEIAEGTLPGAIHLYKAKDSDDLRCIEDSLNMIVREMQARIKLIEDKLKTESSLRKALEQQQLVLLNAERHRVMVQSLGAACHYLGQPATALRLHLYLLKEHARTLEEVQAIEASIKDVDAMEAVFEKLREVNEYRTEPYLHEDGSDGHHILAI